jgi:hypothetical protein
VAGFTADGLSRGRRSPEYRQARREVIARVKAEFAPRFAEAGLLGKPIVWVKRRRQLERELEDLAPRRAFYGHGP